MATHPVSPSSLPSVAAEVYREKKSPERTSPPRECPEITVVSPRDEDLTVSPSCLGHREDALKGSDGNPSGDRCIEGKTEKVRKSGWVGSSVQYLL